MNKNMLILIGIILIWLLIIRPMAGKKGKEQAAQPQETSAKEESESQQADFSSGIVTGEPPEIFDTDDRNYTA